MFVQCEKNLNINNCGDLCLNYLLWSKPIHPEIGAKFTSSYALWHRENVSWVIHTSGEKATSWPSLLMGRKRTEHQPPRAQGGAVACSFGLHPWFSTHALCFTDSWKYMRRICMSSASKAPCLCRSGFANSNLRHHLLQSFHILPFLTLIQRVGLFKDIGSVFKVILWMHKAVQRLLCLHKIQIGARILAGILTKLNDDK